MASNDRIRPNQIVEEMKLSYLDYSMSVIVSRALPDVRDGLKPVHRRVLFGMNELSMGAGRAFKKSARLVGEVLGKYHPHGDSAVYDSLVRMAQEFSMRYPLVDGQGNFGSIDGDAPAAMRYTEVRMKRMAEEMLRDLDKETVDFQSNFDDSLEEPKVLPSAVPNLLVNGSSGIAVGMATNIPPHNLGEVVNALLAMIDNPEIELLDLMDLVKAPDFPTGGIIYGMAGVREAYRSGRGRCVIRAKASFETKPNGRESIIIHEIPFMTNKASIIEKIAELVKDKKVEGISDIRDESDREGMRVVIDLKKDAMGTVVLNQLYKYTQLQNTFGIIMLALVGGIPRVLSLKEVLRHYLDHRMDVVIRRTRFELKQAEARAHILEGLKIALDHLDEVISLIRSSPDTETAQSGLMTNFGLSEIQAKAILEMRLQRLTGLERQKIEDEYQELLKLIEKLRSILDSELLRLQIIREELNEVREKYADERRSEIVQADDEIDMEDLIADDQVVVTLSNQGFIKRVAIGEYRAQGRGGRGITAAAIGDDDYMAHMMATTNHQWLMFFTNLGRCYWLKTWVIPEGSRQSRGRSIANLLNMLPGEKVAAFIAVRGFDQGGFIMKCTRKGIVKKTELEAYSNVRKGGIIAVNIREDDELIEARLTSGTDQVILGSRFGKSIRFEESDVRDMGRNATGVKGMTLEDGDEVVGMVTTGSPDISLLVVTEKGLGKRSPLDEYRVQTRGGKGILTVKTTDKNGKMVAIREVDDTKDLMIITTQGTIIRQACSELRDMGRNTQGVRLIRLNEGDTIAAVEVVDHEELIDDQTPSA
ncbi:MAG: DNA gyrase subunit A [Bacteroidetes bacterium]|nr:DNA gyrase subunit A [Bacteroidota bacterium]